MQPCSLGFPWVRAYESGSWRRARWCGKQGGRRPACLLLVVFFHWLNAVRVNLRYTGLFQIYLGRSKDLCSRSNVSLISSSTFSILAASDIYKTLLQNKGIKPLICLYGAFILLVCRFFVRWLNTKLSIRNKQEIQKIRSPHTQSSWFGPKPYARSRSQITRWAAAMNTCSVPSRTRQHGISSQTRAAGAKGSGYGRVQVSAMRWWGGGREGIYAITWKFDSAKTKRKWAFIASNAQYFFFSDRNIFLF